jgi:hypothetical protein
MNKQNEVDSWHAKLVKAAKRQTKYEPLATGRHPFVDDSLDPRADKTALNKQIGGSHYRQMKIQPWEIIDAHNLNFYEGNILKYLLRRKDNRVEDLKKLIHYAEHAIELELNLKPTKKDG